MHQHTPYGPRARFSQRHQVTKQRSYLTVPTQIHIELAAFFETRYFGVRDKLQTLLM